MASVDVFDYAKNLVGTARVAIPSLEFIPGRQIDPEIVTYLRRVFQQTGCRRLDPDNFIPVFITRADLDRALRASALTSNALKRPSPDGSLCFLNIATDQKLKCLHGRHRVQAATEHLKPHDLWWTVRLFLASPEDIVNEKIIAPWRDQYYHQSALCDGEIYRNIRLNNDRGKWMSMLTPCKQIAVIQLLKHEDLTRAFDDLLEITALWIGFELGNIQKLLAIGCFEEIIRYLRLIKAVWDFITLYRSDLKLLLEIQSVQALELRAPGRDIEDREFIEKGFRKGLIFPKILNPLLRSALQEAILKIPHFIPTLKSMFENLKYLEAGANIIKDLILGRRLRSSVHESLYRAWNKEGCATIIAPNNRSYQLKDLPVAVGWDITYKQIWIFALREFPQLGSRQPLKEVGAKTCSIPISASMQYEFVSSVSNMGVKTTRILDRLAKDPRTESLRACLATIYQSYTPDKLDDIVARMVMALPTISPSVVVNDTNTLYTDSSDISRRWGVPHEFTYAVGRTEFFFPKLVKDLISATVALETPSFLADFFWSFFGPINKAPIELLTLISQNNEATTDSFDDPNITASTNDTPDYFTSILHPQGDARIRDLGSSSLHEPPSGHQNGGEQGDVMMENVELLPPPPEDRPRDRLGSASGNSEELLPPPPENRSRDNLDPASGNSEELLPPTPENRFRDNLDSASGNSEVDSQLVHSAWLPTELVLDNIGKEIIESSSLPVALEQTKASPVREDHLESRTFLEGEPSNAVMIYDGRSNHQGIIIPRQSLEIDFELQNDESRRSILSWPELRIHDETLQVVMTSDPAETIFEDEIPQGGALIAVANPDEAQFNEITLASPEGSEISWLTYSPHMNQTNNLLLLEGLMSERPSSPSLPINPYPASTYEKDQERLSAFSSIQSPQRSEISWPDLGVEEQYDLAGESHTPRALEFPTLRRELEYTPGYTPAIEDLQIIRAIELPPRLPPIDSTLAEGSYTLRALEFPTIRREIEYTPGYTPGYTPAMENLQIIGAIEIPPSPLLIDSAQTPRAMDFPLEISGFAPTETEEIERNRSTKLLTWATTSPQSEISPDLRYSGQQDLRKEVSDEARRSVLSWPTLDGSMRNSVSTTASTRDEQAAPGHTAESYSESYRLLLEYPADPPARDHLGQENLFPTRIESNQEELDHQRHQIGWTVDTTDSQDNPESAHEQLEPSTAVAGPSVDSGPQSRVPLVESVKLSNQPQTTQSPVLLRFLEYNGMSAKSLVKTKDDMKAYLSNRLGWLMFVRTSSACFQTIPRPKVIQYMITRPNELYCLTNQREWWQRRGIKYIRDHKKRLTANKVASAVQTSVKLTGWETVVREESSRDPEEAKYFATDTVKVFKREFNILDCERAFKDTHNNLDSTQGCFLRYDDENQRTLERFEVPSFPLAARTAKDILAKYICMFNTTARMQEFDLQKLPAVAKIFPVWLIVREGVPKFLGERDRSTTETQSAKLSSSQATPLSPVLGGVHREETLFSDESDDDSYKEPRNSSQTRPTAEPSRPSQPSNVIGSSALPEDNLEGVLSEETLSTGRESWYSSTSKTSAEGQVGGSSQVTNETQRAPQQSSSKEGNGQTTTKLQSKVVLSDIATADLSLERPPAVDRNVQIRSLSQMQETRHKRLRLTNVLKRPSPVEDDAVQIRSQKEENGPKRVKFNVDESRRAAPQYTAIEGGVVEEPGRRTIDGTG